MTLSLRPNDLHLACLRLFGWTSCPGVPYLDTTLVATALDTTNLAQKTLLRISGPSNNPLHQLLKLLTRLLVILSLHPNLTSHEIVSRFRPAISQVPESSLQSRYGPKIRVLLSKMLLVEEDRRKHDWMCVSLSLVHGERLPLP